MDYDYLAQSLAALAGIPVRIYRDGAFQGLYHHTKFKPDPAILEEPNIFRAPGNVSYYMDGNFLYYGLFRSAKDNAALVLGPVAQVAVDRGLAVRILRSMGESAGRADELAGYFASMPAYPLRNFLQILCTVNYFLNGEKLDVGQLLLSAEHMPAPAAAPAPDPPRAAHSTGGLEALMLSCVEHGRVDEIKKLFQRPVAGRAGPMAADALRQEKNLVICTATLVTRAAIRGGLDRETAFSLSDAYIQRAELMDDYAGLVLLNLHMVEDFTRRVADARCGGGSSPLVRTAREYILLHLDRAVTTQELSRALGMNRTYLCKRFQEEAGMTVNHYVTAVKLDEARRLLEVTKKTPADIAGVLGYSSQSYFQRVFKKVVGVTPGEYRRGLGEGGQDRVRRPGPPAGV